MISFRCTLSSNGTTVTTFGPTEETTTEEPVTTAAPVTTTEEASTTTTASPGSCQCGVAQRATRIVGGSETEVNL